jgi:polyhydroxybutyrate depolymerase
MRPIASLLLILLSSSPLAAKVYDRTAEVAGLRVQYKVALPQNFDPAKTYPAILAFPPGSQGMDMVMTTMQQNWRAEADRRGYIVVIPATPLLGQSFTGAAAKIFPEFIEKLLREYKIRDNKFHIAGMSNGGRSAFHIAAMYPQYFLSVTGLPGYMPDATPQRVAALSTMCIYMHVGELDTGWVDPMQEQASMFQSKGYTVRFTIEKGEGHVMRTLAFDRSGRLFDEIAESRKGCKAK